MLGDIIPSHQVASWLLKTIDGFLDTLGLQKDKVIEEIIYVTIIVFVALFLGWLIRKLILVTTRKFVKLRHTNVGRTLLDQHVFTRCSHIIPPLVILALLPFAFETKSPLLHVLNVIVIIYFLIAAAVAINTVLGFFWTRFDDKDNTKNLPLRGILNVANGLVWIIVAIIGISVIIDKSPAVLLTGLGAFAAALMLIFKDSILGLVAGIQLSQNDMVRIGDWIVVPSTPANGVVTSVSLTAVKVLQWDNTTVSFPPYTLVSTCFQNYRSMSESGGRQICRSVIFDYTSVKAATPELIDRVTKLYPSIKDYVDNLVKTGKNDYNPGLAVINGTAETNLGLFRAYMCSYIINHPEMVLSMQVLVSVKAPTGQGIPLQIYCYTTTAWTAFEAIQSQIFEHIAAACPDFDLVIYNAPSGHDIDALSDVMTPGQKAAEPSA
ncbi:MAG: mechanosensitive ion channel family protein [Bacteroidales bacterium]|nr:mechanosensitive ion channel family protein [Bacteroidales bacterium]